MTAPQPGPANGDDRRDRPPSPFSAGLEISQALARYGAGLVRTSWAAAAATIEALLPHRPHPRPGPPGTAETPAPPGAGAPVPEGSDVGAASHPPAAQTPVEEAAGAATDAAAEAPAAPAGGGQTAASTADSIQAEAVGEVVADLEETDSAPPEQPPIPAWDQLTLASIRARLARLEEAQLAALHAWEQAHAGRPAVLSMLENRITKLRLAAGPPGGLADQS